MNLREEVSNEISNRNANIETKFWVMKMVMSLIQTLSDSEHIYKDKWIEQQEELKVRLWEEIANDMDYIISWQKYVNEMKDILSADDK